MRFCGVYERLIGNLESQTMQLKEFYKQIIPS